MITRTTTLRGITVLLVVAGLFAFLAVPQSTTPAQAQVCPLACQASSPECTATSNNSNGSCPAQWTNQRCSNVPCAFRDACGCGFCLDGCNAVCTSQACGYTGGSTGGSTGGTGGSNSGTTVPGGSNTGGTNPGSTTTQKTPQKLPLSTECANRCDLNKDGMITKDDFRSITTDQQATLQYCFQSCPWADGANAGAGGGNGGTVPQPTSSLPVPGKLLGDCSGTQPGVPDGRVTIQDVEYFRQELNNEVKTLSCDFDRSGDTDITDFTNYLRPGFVQYNNTPTTGGTGTGGTGTGGTIETPPSQQGPSVVPPVQPAL